MKKIYLLLLVFATLCTFTACSDDDDDTAPVCPVTGYTVPATATAGSTISIPGTGYIQGAKIILKNAQNQETEATDIQVSTSSITGTIPSTLAVGTYKVILRQSGDWELGSITVEAAGPIEDLDIPQQATAGDKITIGGKGFDENTKIYLESDDLTADELVISNVTATGLMLDIPAILPGGSYRVMLDQGDGVKLGIITISEKSTPCVVSRIIKVTSYGNDSIVFNYDNGKISSITFISGDPIIYNVNYKSENSIAVDYTPSYGYPVTWEYTLSAGKVTTALMKTQETQYDEEGNEAGAVDKISEYNFSYTSENYLEQINQQPENSGYNTFSFHYNEGKMDEFISNNNYPVMPEDPDEGEVTVASVPVDQEIETYTDTYTFNYNKQINNLTAFDVMSVIMYEVAGNDCERLIRLLGIGGKYPAQLPTSYDANGEQKIDYTIINGYVTKIVFPDEEYPESTDTYRIEYQ